MTAIEVNNLNKHYGDFHAIKNVSIEVEQGEIYGFVGPNGSGKSTLIRSILGLLKTTSGSASILGMDALKNGAEVRELIGYLPSEVHYYDEMSSRELLEYSARFYKNADLSKIDSLAEYFQLDLNKKITDLSFGNKKKCSIIQSVLHQPKLLILDEPTSGLDPLMQNRFFDLIEEENKKGTTVFFSSHILSEIQRMCDRAAVIREGSISAIEDIQVLLEKQMKKVRVVFATVPEDKTLPIGSQHEKWNDSKLSFEFVGPVGVLIDWLSKQDLHDAVLVEPDLESIFMNYYQQ
ncbi:MAG: ABC transporter ATP-binding protein [Crocinitomicaceae bacterium]|nr:ABC transporter ATP-binding protein [Crocinitomicaceae bacterium]